MTAKRATTQRILRGRCFVGGEIGVNRTHTCGAEWGMEQSSSIGDADKSRRDRIFFWKMLPLSPIK